MIIGKHYSRTRCIYGKGHLNDRTNCPCPILYCKLGRFAFRFNRYPEELKKCTPLTGKNTSVQPKIPN